MRLSTDTSIGPSERSRRIHKSMHPLPSGSATVPAWLRPAFLRHSVGRRLPAVWARSRLVRRGNPVPAPSVSPVMATLDAKTRAGLPDSAFAYIDSAGKRRLPIHDESHVRNALSRFNQVRFESEEARERAFRKLLKEAIAYGIAPVGFVAGRMREARSGARPHLPSGQVTLMLTDIEGSTRLVERLADAYPQVLEDVRELIRVLVKRGKGCEVDARADEFFAVFATAGEALGTAVGIQREIGERKWPARVRIRVGLHSGSPGRTDTGYVGMPVHVAARVCSAGHGGQILVSASTREELAGDRLGSFRLERVGSYVLHGLSQAVELYQVHAPGLVSTFPPLRIGTPG